MPLCGIFGNGCEVALNLAGNIYRDSDESCTENAGEPALNNIKLLAYQNGSLLQQVYSNNNGQYSFDTDPGSYEVRVDTTGLPFTVECPAGNSVTSSLIATDLLNYAVDFGLKCKPGVDLTVSSIVNSAGMFFPAQHATVKIFAGDMVLLYGTTCNTTGLPGTVTATFDGPASLTGISGNGIQSGNTVTWNVSDFAAIPADSTFELVFLTETLPWTNTFICVDAMINANAGPDANHLNDTLSNCFAVVNSFDPNFKEVSPVTVHQPGDWHTYTIHFQNTGTAPAIHILLKDTLDVNLDWSSFRRTAASHENLTQVLDNGIIHFNFPNINLADSTSDEPNSHGWIQHRIKTKSGISPGTAIHNSAAIYFDFNEPVITNDALLTYGFVSIRNSISDQHLTIFPNPANGVLTIRAEKWVNTSFVITDLAGRVIINQAFPADGSASVDLKGISPGSYSVTLIESGKIKDVKKLVIIR